MNNYAYLTGNKEIEINLGDTRTLQIEFEDAEVEKLVSKMIFTCNFFDIQGNFIKDNNTNYWIFELPVEKIKCPITTSYDITLELRNDDGTNETISQTGIRFTVKEKKNPLNSGVGNG